ncbi:hypothetical protein HDR63_01130 [bacterium]|nr:hypothetical protein [bacterium]
MSEYLEKDEIKKQEDRKLVWTIGGSVALAILFVGGTLLFIDYAGGKFKQERQKNSKLKSEFVVRSKKNGRITYTPVWDKNANDTLLFNRRSAVDSLVYNYISVGDTLIGDRDDIYRPLPPKSDGISVVGIVDIKKKLNHETVKRDSIIRSMQEKVK